MQKHHEPPDSATQTRSPERAQGPPGCAGRSGAIEGSGTPVAIDRVVRPAVDVDDHPHDRRITSTKLVALGLVPHGEWGAVGFSPQDRFVAFGDRPSVRSSAARTP